MNHGGPSLDRGEQHDSVNRHTGIEGLMPGREDRVNSQGKEDHKEPVPKVVAADVKPIPHPQRGEQNLKAQPVRELAPAFREMKDHHDPGENEDQRIG